MSQQKMEVELLNVIKYTTKDNRQRTLLRYRPINDNCVSNIERFKGISVLESYFDGFGVFDKIPLDYFGANVDLYYEKIPRSDDPFKDTTKIVKINDISLV